MLILDKFVVRVGTFAKRYDLTAARGTLTALVGPSGGGKSTLLHAIAGFERDTSGTLTLDANDLTGLPPSQRPVSILFQDHNLFPGLTAFQNAALGARPNLHITATDTTNVQDALRRVGLAGLDHRKPFELSGGQRQRVALARCLLMKRPILLLDEPFSGLDPALRLELGTLIANLIHDHGFIGLIATHTLDDVACDVVIEIREEWQIL